MPEPRIPIYYSRAFSRFSFGQGHPFGAGRFAGFISLIEKAGLEESVEIMNFDAADRYDIRLAHSDDFIDRVEYLARTGGRLTLDTPANPDVLDIQKLIAGSGLAAAEFLLKNDVPAAHTFGGFHHAGKDYGEGFCLLNDVAIVGKDLIENRGLERVLIIDTDAHQGNGTMDIFYDNPKVLFMSIHQDPRTLYPGRGFVDEIGEGEGSGFTVNMPLPPYAGNVQYEKVMLEIFRPIAGQFNPQLIIRNGGSDPYIGDELTNLGLDYKGLQMLGSIVRQAADETCGKLLDMMVSGYGDYVIEGWLALFAGVEGLTVDFEELELPGWRGKEGYPPKLLDKLTDRMLKDLKQELGEYWDF